MQDNMQKRKKNIWKRLVLVVIVLALALYGVCDYCYRSANQKRYADKIAFYEKCTEQEKQWIMKQQHPQGALYLYEPESGVPEAVNPYFACLAAEGLLAGEPNMLELQSVERYLRWHAAELIKRDGFVCDYQVADGEVTALDTYDSVDSYIAVFLGLFAEYIQKGGEPGVIPQDQEAIEICIKRLQELSQQGQKGLTCVSPENSTCYLMDNTEVLSAYQKMNQVVTNPDFDDRLRRWKKKEAYKAFFDEAAKTTETAMKDVFWKEEKERFEIGLNGNQTYIEFQGIEEFYPYAIAQIYPVAFDLWLTEEEKLEALYQNISDTYDWTNSSVDEKFDWPVLSYIAVQMGDMERAERYIEEYRKAYQYDRSYPMNITDAAWVAKSSEALRAYYETQAKKSLFEKWMDRF